VISRCSAFVTAWVIGNFNIGDFDESPYEAIAYAEETGRIHEFDIAMVHKIVEWLNTKPRNSDKYRVAVNISANSVDKPEYVNALHTLLKENIWLKDKLMFEITESASIIDSEVANTFIHSLRKQDYHVCLDDFGAGAASFQYLSTLEVDAVKLNGSAIANAQKWHKGKAFLPALADLCNKMGVETITEWIESDTDFNFVKECGIDYVQGFLFGKPSLDAEDFKQLPSSHLFAGKVAPTSRMRRP
jgi:EAL domain-containing protein (putative c-di-GMP-specific phosphodiesterase class I)